MTSRADVLYFNTMSTFIKCITNNNDNLISISKRRRRNKEFIEDGIKNDMIKLSTGMQPSFTISFFCLVH